MRGDTKTLIAKCHGKLPSCLAEVTVQANRRALRQPFARLANKLVFTVGFSAGCDDSKQFMHCRHC